MNAVKSTKNSPDQNSRAGPDHDSSNRRKPDLHTSPHTERKSVLQLRLQQRRTREQLADQGIMPPLKSPAAFHEQRKSLERSKTGDYLKHKIRSRPDKSELINMHILQDTASEGPAQDSQTKLKRARLADNLNEKIALRPGPLELVEKNIIPVDSTVKEAAIKVNHGKYPKQEDSYAFEEDSSNESLSPEQPHSEESQGFTEPLPENKTSGSASPTINSTSHGSQNKDVTTQNQEDNAHATNNQASPPIPVPAIVKQSKMSDKNRHKKPKDIKPKVKKLKYHQYIPPDQKAEKSPPPPMDSAYARLLQQQQLFLQLQILSQQKHQQHSHSHQHQCPQSQSFSYQPLNQHTPNKQSSEQQTSCSSSVPTSGVNSSSSSPVKTTYCNPTPMTSVRPGPLPANLDDLKVSELRQQLRIRGLPVSGTKTALIERLRPFKDSSSSSPSSSGDISTMTFPVTPTGSLSSYQSPGSSSVMSHGGGYYPFCSTSSTPPISPASSDLSVSGSLPDSFSDVTMSSPQFGLQPSPAQLSTDEAQSISGGLGMGCQAGLESLGIDAEKDKMLVEKQKVIEELIWKLHQEQRQVEELRMQLHKRKRGHCLQDCPAPPPGHPPQHMMHLQPPAQMQQFYEVSVKQEHVASSCPLSSKQLKGCPSNSCLERMDHCDLHSSPHCLEVPSSGSPPGLSAFLSPQCSPQDSPVTKNSSSPQPNSLPSSPSHPYMLTPPLGRDGCSHSVPRNGPRTHNMQLQQKNIGQSVSCGYASDRRSLQPIYQSPAENNLNHRGLSKAKNANMQKQMTRSQQMDELLDVLIESGEMPANAKDERSPVTKVVPHLTVSPSSGATSIPKFHRHFSHTFIPYDHVGGHGDGHLEVLLSRQGDAVLLKMGAEDGHLEEAGESFTVPQHDEKLLINRDMMDTPLSPMATKVSPVAAENQGLFTESPWETMEWLDLTPPSSATAFNSSIHPPGPSIFNTEFLDVTDINLNSAMDLHLEHW
ncbi:myocardin isoform X6 [Triplophysa rosa]|uniref:myocardin isoform X6 n=1 Tax=Triplophysa rosa TaxID=992332 RepID=UPI002545F878|nr:myocardin isoform X6 [Triplophysa rosa]